MSLLRTVMFGRCSSLIKSSSLVRPAYLAQSMRVRCVSLKASPAEPPEELGHDEKNALLNRPLSPHLTIYKAQLTSMMSISHRISGLALSGCIIGLAACSFCPMDMPHIVQYIQGMGIPSPLIFSAKFVLAFPLAYHTINGIRHMSWDFGIGLTLKEVYMSGYATLGLTAIATLILASL